MPMNTLSQSNMVEQQIRPWNIFSPQVLHYLHEVPRDIFVPVGYKSLAYADIEIPLGHERWMFTPRMVAKALDTLAIQATDSVLEIGTGSGYLTVLLAKLAKQVTSVDNLDDFSQSVAQKLSALAITNVTLTQGELLAGWSAGADYDAIVVSGAVDTIPTAWQKQLAIGGRLFAVVGQAPSMDVCCVTRVGEKQWQTKVLFETCTASLPVAMADPIFKF